MMNPSLLQQAITFREVMDQPIATPDENKSIFEVWGC